MLHFEPIEDSLVLLVRNGVFIESKLFVRNTQVFAKLGSGYIRLHPMGTTSVNKIYWKELHSNLGGAVQSGPELRWVPMLEALPNVVSGGKQHPKLTAAE